MTSCRPRSLAELLEDPTILEPPAPILPRLAFQGLVTLLAAREKDGKSTLLGSAVAAASRGLPFLGEETPEEVTVLILTEEPLGGLTQRLNQMGASPERVFLLRIGEMQQPLEDLKEVVSSLAPSVVLVDTLGTFANNLVREAGSSTEWTAVMRVFADLAYDEGGPAVVLLHHSRKSDGKYRDSTAIGANVDLIIEMSRDSSDSRVRRFKVLGRIPVEDFQVRFKDGRYELVGDAVVEKILVDVLEFVVANPECSKRKVRDNVYGASTRIDCALKELMEKGDLLDEDEGKSKGYKVAPHVSEGLRRGVPCARLIGSKPGTVGDTSPSCQDPRASSTGTETSSENGLGTPLSATVPDVKTNTLGTGHGWGGRLVVPLEMAKRPVQEAVS